MPNSVDFSKKALVLITGASKGIGRTIAVEISRNLNENSVIVLLARSEAGLEQSKAAIQEIDKSLTVIVHVTDLSKPDVKAYETLLDRILASIDTSGVEFGVIFHNAGSMGDMKKTTDLTNSEVWRNYFDLNLSSVALLNSAFIRKVRPIAPQLVVVNVTSLCGRTPFENFAMYGSGKAARDMFFKVLALEEEKIIVLNYSPGPVDTDMFDSVIEGAQSEEVRENFKKMKAGTALKAEQTVEKLLGILEKGDFKSGDTIDYYDSV